ncbi:alpha/beta hydrolase [Salipiger mucosus]|uniref:Uncharacterized protein n=1 Tax=Salipiger mucosus DSM 16094 TaxID=1123237 RepID=S9RDR5_9RHOB|nr:alpha/beta hydrolase [Salipiger mucosus]EPX76270.1 hypothetical protein Salmuc_01256 [Salipiger mucosus DSM 16094]
MTPEQIVAAIGMLVSEPDPAFDTLREGGFDPRYPVTIAACPETTAPLDVEGHTLICGTVSVPERYDAPDGRRVPLTFALGRAQTTQPFEDAIVYLHGGPASGSLGSISATTEVILGGHRAHRDVVTFDQRAAMLSSTTVRCREVMADNIVGLARSAAGRPEIAGEEAKEENILAPCIEELQAGDADLAAYNTANNARDVQAVMSALGYPEYNIFGISYGTRLALEVLRTAPEGVRAVIIDGVAPTGVKLYDDLFGPHGDSLEAMFDQCAADAGCAAAYPELRDKTLALGDILSDNPIPAARGMPAITSDLFYGLVMMRTKHSATWTRDLTGYLPRMIYELSEGDPTTFDWYLTTYSEPKPKQPADLLAPGAERLSDDERALALAALASAQSMTSQSQSVASAIGQLKNDLVAGMTAVSVAEAFDRRVTEAGRELTHETLFAAAKDYARLLSDDPSKEAIAAWVEDWFLGPDREALLALVAAMTDEDVARTFATGITELAGFQAGVESAMGLYIYACQEDYPYNSLEGFEEMAAAFPYSVVKTEGMMTEMRNMAATCALFEPAPREGFHDPVVSDVPVLVMGGTNDSQTSWKWSGLAAETLPNSRVVIFPNAGHGSSLFSDCGLDMNVTFILDPEAPLDRSCLAGLAPKFALPDTPLP